MVLGAWHRTTCSWADDSRQFASGFQRQEGCSSNVCSSLALKLLFPLTWRSSYSCTRNALRDRHISKLRLVSSNHALKDLRSPEP